MIGIALEYATIVHFVSHRLGVHVAPTQARHVLVAKRSSLSEASLDFRCRYPDPAALSVWLAAAPVRLVVRLWVVGCPPAASRPKVGGFVGWLFAPVGLAVQLTCYFVGCSRLRACITVDLSFC